MAKKHLLFHSAAREKVLRGASALADAVQVTLGPRSKSVLIGKRWGSPIVCNDAAAVAEGIVPEVVRTALENAVSVAGVLLLTEATMTDVPEPKREAAEAHAME